MASEGPGRKMNSPARARSNSQIVPPTGHEGAPPQVSRVRRCRFQTGSVGCADSDAERTQFAADARTVPDTLQLLLERLRTCWQRDAGLAVEAMADQTKVEVARIVEQAGRGQGAGGPGAG